MRYCSTALLWSTVLCSLELPLISLQISNIFKPVDFHIIGVIMLGLFIFTTWYFAPIVSASISSLLVSASQISETSPTTKTTVHVSVWINSATQLSNDLTLCTITDAAAGPLVLRRFSTQYRASLVLPKGEVSLVAATLEQTSGWEMLVLVLDFSRVILCVTVRGQLAVCSEGVDQRLLGLHTVIFNSLVISDLEQAFGRTAVYFMRDFNFTKSDLESRSLRERQLSVVLRGQAMEGRGETKMAFSSQNQAIVWTWWGKRAWAESEIRFTAELRCTEDDKLPISVIAARHSTSYCITQSAPICAQSRVLLPENWYFFRVEVLLQESSEARFCTTDFHEEIAHCHVVSLGHEARQMTFVGVNFANIEETQSNFHDLRLWTPKESPASPLSHYDSAFEDSKTALLLHRRHLQSTHHAVFSHLILSALASNFFSFENTHISTQTITISAISTGPLVLKGYLNYESAKPANWTASGIDSCSVTITGPGPGTYTVELLVTVGVEAQLSIQIACNEVTSACYCLPGTFPSPDTASCIACSISDYQCRHMIDLACLPTDAGLPLPSGGFSCEHCPVGQYGSSSTGLCGACHGTCYQCVGPDRTDCYVCHDHAELSTPATPSACACSSGFYPALNAATCVQCDGRCSQCAGPGNGNCSACTSNASFSGSTCTCDSGFGSAVNGCLPCPGLCATCEEAVVAQCLSCKAHAQVSAPGPCLCQSDSYLSSDISCSLCSKQCQTCSGPLTSHCATCTLNASLVTTAPCACRCNSGFFPDPNPSNCQSCDSTCVLCTRGGTKGCSVCESQAYLVGGACVCNAGRFFSSSTHLCELCALSCQACTETTPDNCISCFPHAILSSGKAPSSCVCVKGYYGSPNSCLSCHRVCPDCTGPDSTQCLSCYSSAVPAGDFPTSCVCVVGTYLNTVAFTCSPCAPQCYTCAALSSNQCVLCHANSYRANIVAKSSSCVCNPGFYPDPTVAKCEPCAFSCKTCAAAAIICTSCFSNTNLIASNCHCKSGFYANPDVKNCSACDSTCATCALEAVSCITCKSNALPSSSKCVCNSNAFPDTTAANCVLCHYTCASCSSRLITDCRTCLYNAILTIMNTCVCWSNYFPSPAADNCVICYVDCLTCLGSLLTLCLNCHPNASLRLAAPSSCGCDKGFYGSPDASKCLICSNTCAYCYGPSTNQCTICKSHATLDLGVCTCLSAYYRDFLGNCELCDISCLTCMGPAASDCLTCSQSGGVVELAVGGTCSCANPVNAPCYTCAASTCKTCIGSSIAQCVSCYPNASIVGPINSYYKSGRCICNVSYFGSPDNCQPCEPTCYWCRPEDPNHCTDCYSNGSLSGGVCSCIQTYFPNPTSRNCTLCHPTCLSCEDASETKCTSCFTNAKLASESAPDTCVCNVGYYTKTTSRMCLMCDRTCLNCSGSDVAQCTECKDNAALNLSSCKCFNGFYFRTATSQCALCFETCVTCNGGAVSNCLTCFSNASLSSGTCSCIIGYFPNPKVTLCSICDSACRRCSRISENCTACYSHASIVISGGSSTCACNPSYKPTPDVNNCQPCYFECYICVSTSSTACTSCYPHASIPPDFSTGACTCDEGYFADDTAVLCSACPALCRACTGLDNCTLCYTGGVTYITASSQRSCRCASRYFPDPTAANCSACDNSCALCNGAGPFACTSCGTNTENSGGQCRCMLHYYRPTDTANCSVCISSCADCSGNTASDCTQCYANAQLTSPSPNECLCFPSFYAYPSSANCVPCEIMCKQCTGIGLCSACIANASVAVVPGPCACSIAHFYISASNACIPCFPDCKTCSERLFNNCFSCFDNAQLISDSCFCLSGYFAFPNASNCEACNGDCLACNAGGNKACTLCGNNAALLSDLSPGTCLCDSGFWPNSDATHCSPCHSRCSTCVGSISSHCLACHPNAALASGTSPGSCACNQDYFMIAATGLCGLCNERCFVCVESSASSCTQCHTSASLISGVSPGICQCNPGFFPNPTANLCSPCHFHCSTCSAGGANSCDACKPHAVVSSGVCSCDIMYWPDPDPSACSLCHVTCLTCTDAAISHCLTCKSHASLHSGECLCDPGWKPSPLTSLCLVCDLTCQLCVGGTVNECAECFAGAVIAGGLTVGSCVCMFNYFPAPDTAHCLICASTCNSCFGLLSSHCATCYPHAHLSEGNFCVCDTSYWPNPHAGFCLSCHYTCLKCIGDSPNLCTQCSDFATVSNPPGPCHCEVSAYPDPDPSSCLLCHNMCLSCLGPREDQCTSCKSGAGISASAPSFCTCLAAHFPSPDVSDCVACPSDCRNCLSLSMCSDCYVNAELTSDFRCECAQEFFPFPDASSCQSCESHCVSCWEAGCFRCASNYILYKGKCYSSCSSVFGNDNLNCLDEDYTQPVPSLRIELNNSLTVVFNTAMNCTLDISVETATAESLSIALTWSDAIFLTPQEAAVPVVYFDSYIPAGVHVTLFFLVPEQVVSVLGVPIQTTSVSGLLHPKGSPSDPSVRSLQQTQIMSNTVVASSLIVSMLISNPSSFLSAFNQFQLITYLPLSGLPLTKGFAEALAACNAVSMLPNPLVGWLDVTEESQTPCTQEQQYGLTTTLLFPNVVSVFTISACVLLSYIPTVLLSKVPSRPIARYFARRLTAFKWTVPLSVCFTAYLDVAVFSVLQVTHRHFEWSYVGTNSAAGYGVLGLVLLFPCAVAVFFIIHARTLSILSDSRWRFFSQDFAPSKRCAALVHFALFLARRLLLATTAFLLRSSPKYFAVLNTTCCVLICMYMYIVRPHQKTLEKTEALLIESGTTVIYLMAGLFAFNWGSDALEILDQVGVWTVRTVLGVSMTLIMCRLLRTMYSLYAEFKANLRMQKTIRGFSAHITLGGHPVVRPLPARIIG